MITEYKGNCSRKKNNVNWTKLIRVKMNIIERLRMLLRDTVVAKRHEHLEIDSLFDQLERISKEYESLKKELETLKKEK